ncbi:hypothetical protein DZF91_22455 [Actinomadura logoneensis]|uniref:site-specific DNA-methyltransferase (adenine-specific) n=1 Tax=Actinomadura logoneensis TaxID=2293572 RepID=A0A372JHV5_9ACTN|nr:DNA methyltransferase [Actinomadura logoneensis]RFU39434.1 hypothetical protein DZF91_22455 [Actinomadura logoneensis]
MPPRTGYSTTGYDHNDWLGLVDVSGPFLSVPMLRRIWPVLDTLDRPARERLRREHTALPGASWISFVLTELLGWADAVHFSGLDVFELKVPEHGEVLRPFFALLEPGAVPGGDAKPARLLGMMCDGPPNRRVRGSAWAATPVDRLARLCRHHGVELGLVTDGRWWALVWAPRGKATATAVFDSADWQAAAERDVVRAFVSMLRRERFFGVPEEETLPALLAASEDHQEDITEALGVQVRQAVELLVAAIGRAHLADKARGGDGIGDTGAHDVYRGAVVVMMRVLFLLYAEERGLLPSDKEVYRTAYSAGLLCQDLEDRARQGSEEDLEHTHAGWHRLLALFHAVYYGVEHPEMRMRALDGSIFKPDTYAWLPHDIDDRTVLHMLRSVQYVTIGAGRARERRKLSFRSLDVEQIGFVYEGLLAYDAKYADEPVVGLIGKAGSGRNVPLTELEDVAAQCSDVPSLADALAARYKDSRIGTPKALARRLSPPASGERQEARRRLLAATNGDYPLAERLLPFYGLVRTDLRDLPLVILEDTPYVTEPGRRKSSGTHYTPRALAEEVTRGALEALVYEPGPLQTADTSRWKPKTSAEILALNVADIAMGSGAFLVAACRYLAAHLIEAWAHEGAEDALAFTELPGYDTSEMDHDPVVIRARRAVVENCLYGADINALAVEMAKLSLWIISTGPDRPFAFLDDHLVVGDSLLGITSLDQLEVMHMDPKRGRELHKDVLIDWTVQSRAATLERREAIRRIESASLKSLEEKGSLLAESHRSVTEANFHADLTATAALAFAAEGPKGLDKASLQAALAAESPRYVDEAGRLTCQKLDMWRKAVPAAPHIDWYPINWPVVFPEVFARGGFDAIIGNPPYFGGQKLTGELGRPYREYLVQAIGGGARGSADLVAYFVLRAHALLNPSGQTGLIATNTLAQGDTREVGLDQLVRAGVVIRRAIKSRPWPSKGANLEYSAVWTSRKPIERDAGQALSASLSSFFREKGAARRLRANRHLSYIGSYVLGMGFVVDPQAARLLIARDPKNSDVLFPFLNGQDVNSRYDLSASRWVIDFHGRSEVEASGYAECFDRVRCLVKPERSVNNRKVYRDNWWRFAERRPAMLEAISGLDRVVVIALVSKTVMPVMVPTGQVFSHMLGVFATDDTAMLALLSSAPHYWWAVARASSLKGDLRYTPSDVFETLALPELTQEMRELGDRLDRFRRDVMLARQAGLTKTYNLVNDPKIHGADIVELREIHRAIDEAVCRAYGWDDLVPRLRHDHYELDRQIRYTIAAEVRREILDRLLELNQARHAAEIAEADSRRGQRGARPGTAVRHGAH